MTLDSKAFGIAAGVAAALVSAACALIVAIAPDFAAGLFGNVVHLDITALPRKVTWGNAVGSIVFWGIGTGTVFGWGARLYNRMVRPRTQ